MTLLISFVLLMLTSIILYIAPHGRVAYWSDWYLWGFSRTEWGNLHINLGVLFLIAFFLHFYYNLNMIIAYMKNKARKFRLFTGSFNVALVLTAVVCFGTYFMIPPMNLVIKLGEAITAKADGKYGEPPYGHAELSSLKIFSKRVDLDLDKVKKLFEEKGINIEDDSQPILEIAENNNTTAKKLYEIMQTVAEKPSGSFTFPDAPPPGFGRKTLADVCAEYELHVPTIMAALQVKNIKPDLSKTIKDMAEENNMEAMTIFEIIHQAATE